MSAISAGEPSRRVPIRICLVEDDDRLRSLTVRRFGREADFEVVRHYANAERAIVGLPADAPDVVLVDINLPGQSGIECVRQCKPKMPQTQFVMVTVYEDADKIFQALSVGATGYLVKQASGTELIAAIRELHAGGSPMSANIARKVVQSFHHPAASSGGGTPLSAREQQVIDGLVQGLLYKEIADGLSISMGTLHTYIRRIYEKLQVHSRAQAVAKVTRSDAPAASKRMS